MIQTMETEFDEINAHMSHWQGLWKATDLPASSRSHKNFLSSDPHSSSFAEEGSQSRQPFHTQIVSRPWRRSFKVCRSAHLSGLLPVQEFCWSMWCRATGKMFSSPSFREPVLLAPAAGGAPTQHLREGSRMDMGCSAVVAQLTLQKFPSAA